MYPNQPPAGELEVNQFREKIGAEVAFANISQVVAGLDWRLSRMMLS